MIGILAILLLTILSNDNDGHKIPENTATTFPFQQEQQNQQPPSESNGNEHSDPGEDLIPEYVEPAFISGTGTYAGLAFQVNQMKAAGILINYTNTDSCDYCLGWVGGAQVDVKTSVGTFTVSTGDKSQKLLCNSSGVFSVNLGQELIRKVPSITVRDINTLSTSGLPSLSVDRLKVAA